MDAAHLSRDGRRASKRAAIEAGAWTRCLKWLPLKKRFCNVPRSPGSDFCGNHLPVSASATTVSTDGAKARMTCPVDPSHTLFVRDLAAHVKVCNATKRTAGVRALPCYRERCNAGPPCDEDERAIRAFLESIPHGAALTPPPGHPAASEAGARQGGGGGHHGQGRRKRAHRGRGSSLAVEGEGEGVDRASAVGRNGNGTSEDDENDDDSGSDSVPSEADGDSELEDGNDTTSARSDAQAATAGAQEAAQPASSWQQPAAHRRRRRRVIDGGATSATENLLHRLLCAPGLLDLPAFAAKVLAWHAQHVGPIPTEELRTPVGQQLVAAALAAAGGVALRTVRHERQQVSLVGHMQGARLLRAHGTLQQPEGGGHLHRSGSSSSSSDSGHGPSTSSSLTSPSSVNTSIPQPPSSPLLLVEFGAGRGQLSRTVEAFLAAAHASDQTSGGDGGTAGERGTFILIDRGAVRRKADRLLAEHPTTIAAAGTDSDPAPLSESPAARCARTVRVRMDISDFHLPGHPDAWPPGHDACRGHANRQHSTQPGIPEDSAYPSSDAAPSPVQTSPPSASQPPTESSASEAMRHEQSHPTIANSLPPYRDHGCGGLPRQVVALGKHLCGAATDLALRCLAQGTAPPTPNLACSAQGTALSAPVPDGSSTGRPFVTRQPTGTSACHAAHPSPSPSAPQGHASAPCCAPMLHGVAIATCCHHRCSWGAYVGRHWWVNVLGGSPLDFEVARMVSSWAALQLQQGEEGEGGNAGEVDEGEPRSDAGEGEGNEGGGGGGEGFADSSRRGATDGAPAAAVPGATSPGGHSAPSPSPRGLDRAALGRACKRLIDAGRVDFLARTFHLVVRGRAGGGPARSGSSGVALCAPVGSTSSSSAPHAWGSSGGDAPSASVDATHGPRNGGGFTGGGTLVSEFESRAPAPRGGYVRLVHYVDPRVTPENCLLLATTASQPGPLDGACAR